MRGILGADVFAALLLVFLLITGVLLKNINKMGGCDTSGRIESNLPKIQLPKGLSEGLPGGKAKNSVNLSARKTGEEIQYFINDKPVRYADLPVTLKTGQISSVRIRFDRNISYGHYIEILNLCKQAGITDIINVYTTNTTAQVVILRSEATKNLTFSRIFQPGKEILHSLRSLRIAWWGNLRCSAKA